MSSSPDLTQYVDLRLFDRDVQEIYEASAQDLQSKMPGWVPREDNTEVLLLEANALETAESIFAINRLPNTIMTILMRLYGIERDYGAPPTATVTITAIDSFGYNLPAGTRMSYTPSDGTAVVVFVTDAAAEIADGDYTTTVGVTSLTYTDDLNGVDAGTPLSLLDTVAFVESIVTASPMTGGRDPETDQEWLSRGAQRLNRLVDTLAVPSHFTAAALEHPYVSRATTVDLYDPIDGEGAPGDDPGHVSVAVYGADRMLTTEEKAALLTDMEGRTLANLTLHIIDPTITPVDVDIDVVRYPQYTETQTRDAIEAALEAYLNPMTWPWRGVVRQTEIIALISNLPQVDYVDDITAPPAGDTTLPGVAPLATLGIYTGNVA